MDQLTRAVGDRPAAADGTFPRLHLQEPGRFPDGLPPRLLPFHHPLVLAHVHELHDGPGFRVYAAQGLAASLHLPPSRVCCILLGGLCHDKHVTVLTALADEHSIALHGWRYGGNMGSSIALDCLN